MLRKLHRWSPFHLTRGSRTQEDGALLFQGLRVQLTLWYCGVLGVALLLFGVALYAGAEYFLLNPSEHDATVHAQAHVAQWVGDSPFHACTSPDADYQHHPLPAVLNYNISELVICYDPSGVLLSSQNTAGLSGALLNNNLAQSALQSNDPVHDMVDAGKSMGEVYRYAMVVHDPNTGQVLGVVVIGESIRVQESVLSLLLTLLLTVGGIALLGACLGGLFLAQRALAPARLAWTRQQQFIADAAHELRTPLTLLRADAEVLLRSRERLPEEDAALLEDIVAEAQHMAALSNNMLTLARLDNRASHQEQEVVYLAQVVHQAVRRVQALADQQNIALHVDVDESAVVIGDSMLLLQAVLALLDNAIKYNRPDGEVTVRTLVKGEQILLQVIDTGIGIPDEHLSHLGERFYRVDKARSREAGGTGLGLSIVRKIATSHHGTLTIESVVDQGTTATFALPLAHNALSSDSGEKSVLVP